MGGHCGGDEQISQARATGYWPAALAAANIPPYRRTALASKGSGPGRRRQLQPIFASDRPCSSGVACSPGARPGDRKLVSTAFSSGAQHRSGRALRHQPATALSSRRRCLPRLNGRWHCYAAPGCQSADQAAGWEGGQWPWPVPPRKRRWRWSMGSSQFPNRAARVVGYRQGDQFGEARQGLLRDEPAEDPRSVCAIDRTGNAIRFAVIFPERAGSGVARGRASAWCIGSLRTVSAPRKSS